MVVPPIRRTVIMAFFDVIIPTFQNGGELDECLQGLAKQSFQDFSVYICVDGAAGTSYEFLKIQKWPFPLKVIHHPGHAHRGRNATRNLALPYLNAEYVLLLDSDIVPDADLLRLHRELLISGPCVSVGEIVYTNCGQNRLADYLQRRGKNKFPDRSRLAPKYLATANIAMKRRHFTEIGGMDATIVSYGGDDIELGLRYAMRFGLPVIYNKRAVGRSNLKKNIRTLMLQIETFGAENLPAIRRKYPDADDIFQIGIIEGTTARPRIIRLFLSMMPVKSLVRLAGRAPRFISRMIIHMLILTSLYRGYMRK